MSGDSIQGTETVCLFLRADFCCRRVLLDVFDCTVKLLIMGKGWHRVFTRYSQYRNPFFYLFSINFSHAVIFLSR